MPNLGGFLKGLGQQAGYNIMYGQELQQQQDVHEQRQQLIASEQQRMADAAADREKLRTEATETKKLFGQVAEGQLAATTSEQKAASLGKVKMSALLEGRLDVAKAITGLQEDAVSEATVARTEAKAVKEVATEKVAQLSFDVTNAPTPEAKIVASQALVQAYTDAGGDTRQVPPPGSPEFDRWATTQHARTKTAKQRSDDEATVTAVALKQKQQQAEQDRNYNAGRADHRDTIANQHEVNQLKRSELLLKQGEGADKATIDRIAKDVMGGEDMPKGLTKSQNTAIQARITELRAGGAVQEHFAKGTYAQQYAQRQTQAGQILLTESKNIAGMTLGQTAGVFSDLEMGKGITTALTKQFGNQLTKTEAAEYNTSMAATGVEVATLMSSGRQPQKTLIEEFQSTLRGNAGDSVETVLYKRAVMMNLARSALSVAPSANATDKANKTKILEQLATFPTPTEVRETAEASGHTIQGMSSINRKMQEVSEKFTVMGEKGAPGTSSSWGTGTTASGATFK